MRQLAIATCGAVIFAAASLMIGSRPTFAQTGCIIRHIVIGPPDAGLQVTQVVPTGVLWDLQSLATLYYAHAIGTVRTVMLRARTGTIAYSFSPNPLQINPGSTVALTWSAGLPLAVPLAQDVGVAGWPTPLSFASGDILETVTANGNVLDQFMASLLVVRECPN